MAEIISKEILKKIYRKRPENSRKYDFGNLLIVGGSEYYTGAPALSALAAFAAGVDMARIAAPRRASDIIAAFSPLMATTPLEGSRLNKDHLSLLREVIGSMAAVAPGRCAAVIGGGIGRSDDTVEAVREFVFEACVPMVIDADAVGAFVANSELLAGKPLLFTPHDREFFELTGNKVGGKSDEEKIEIVRNQAKGLGITIILKGETDIISDGENVALSKTGNALMTKGGTGDTLAGIAGALLARGASLFDAAAAAAYINGAAGDFIANDRGEGGTAIDLIGRIPEVLPKHRYE